MDEQNFREGLNKVSEVLKVFVAAKKNKGQSFIDEINRLYTIPENKSKFQEFYEKYNSYNSQPVNVVRARIIEKLLTTGTVTFDDVTTIQKEEAAKYDHDVFNTWTPYGILYALYYYFDDKKSKVLGILKDINSNLLNDTGLDEKKAEQAFDYNNHFGIDDFYLGVFNKTHDSRATATQFRIQSKGNNKLLVGLFKNRAFVKGKFNEFEIDKITYQDLLNELNTYKEDILNDEWVNLIDYIKSNIDNFADVKEKAKKEREDFVKKYPLESLKNLTVEQYNTGAGNLNEGSFTSNLNTEYAIAGWLFSNGQNWLFYKGEDGKYTYAKNMKDYIDRGDGDYNKAFSIYVNDLYNFVKSFDVKTYNPKDFLDGAKYIKAALILMYYGDIFLTLGLSAVCLSVAKYLNLLPSGHYPNLRRVDIIDYDLKLSEYFKKEIPDIVDNYGYSALGKCIYDYYTKYLYPKDDTDKDEDNIEGKTTSLIGNIKPTKMNNSTISLNTILYGVPGTGKTYNTVNYAVAAIEGKSLDEVCKEEWTIVKERYNQYKLGGQIVFTTFHQSFGYEDFVEGIKAKVENNGNINYEVESGIFKNLCEVAESEENITTVTKSNVDVDKVQIFKMSLGEVGVEDGVYDYCIDNNVISLGFSDIDFTELKKGATVKEIKKFISKRNTNEEIGFTADAIYRFKSQMNEGDLVIISKGNLYLRAIGKVTSEYYYDENSSIGYKHFRKVEWLLKDVNIPVERINTKKFSQQSIYKLKDNSSKETSLKLDEIKSLIGEKKSGEKRNYVLIIDEINRGNISKIFGELITLIEPNKRLGGKEQIKVKLPYSQKEFGVPNNLYILGTMNTADRSIALMDLALRRRFKFREIEPNPDLLEGIIVAGINIKELFITLNKRIEFLYDRDRLLGHAYFLPLKKNNSLEKLNSIMLDNIVPLLQEYFHDDWEKIQLVLGEGIVKSEMMSAKALGINNSEYEDYPKYTINTHLSAQDYSY